MANTLKFGNGEWYGKKDTILAYNSENNNYKPLPFDFSRASSATRVNKAGLIETVGSGEPRIDYKDDVKGALLLEPSRTNLYAYSEDFSNAAWTKSAAIVALTSNISPDGTTNSVYNLTGTNANLYTGGTTGIEHTISIYAKSNGQGKDNFKLRLGNSLSSSITVTDEWVRYEFTATPTTNVFGLTVDSNPNNQWDILIWGAQLEEGSYATSYIPTSGSAVTRIADTNVSQNTPSGIIGQTEGSVFINIDVNSKVLSSSWAFSLNDGTTSNYIGLRRSGGAEFFVHINVSGTTTALIGTGITSGNNKISIGYKFNDIVVYVNGVNVGVDTSSGVPLTNKVQIGDLISNRILEDSVSDFKLYNTRLSNAELQALTQV